MVYYSTNDKSRIVSLREAVVQGLAPDKGLYMPQQIPQLPKGQVSSLKGKSLKEISMEVASAFLRDDIAQAELSRIVEKSISFEAPLTEVAQDVFSLELFHGPTFAFKDFGARFLAGLLGHFAQQQNKKITILVATSGDTGSAVANGFLNVEGVNVVVLYPAGKVSEIQEKQFTTLGGNITAVEVAGTFDDCQQMVKEAFMDAELRNKLMLTSANSINIARLIPQMFYYFGAWAQLPHPGKPVVVAVPSGNFGNLTAGLIAKRMGLPISHFIAVTNINDVVPEFLMTGSFKPRASRQTISNAMDVGNPSNFFRMMELYDGDVKNFRNELTGYSFDDEETKAAIIEMLQKNNYLMDPHGAVAYLGLKKFLSDHPEFTGIFLETAHPAKFKDVMEETIKREVEVPEGLKKFMQGKKQSVPMTAKFDDFKNYLLATN